VALEPGRVLVTRDQEQRAREIEHEQPAEDRMETTDVRQTVLHDPFTLILYASPVNPAVQTQVPASRKRTGRMGFRDEPEPHPFRAAQIIPMPQTIRSTGQ